jgi:RNA polymerase sigma factor (sigma-70 family)
MNPKKSLWEIYNKIEEYAKAFCIKSFSLYQIKLEDCTTYITDKVMANDMRKIKLFKGESSISTYAYVVARNLFYDFNKKSSTKIKQFELNEEITVGNSEIDSLLEFESLLKHLNLNQQLILKLKRDELTSKEIAPIVGMKPKEVDREYEKMKKKLRGLEK